MINECVQPQIAKLSDAVWNVFSILNGNPSYNNSGVYFSLMLSFSIFLVIVLQLRTKLIFDTKHLVAFVGAVILVFRVLVLFGFEWGWQIGLYDDAILHFLAPPLEHFFNMMYLMCIAYYTLVLFNYFPGILQRFIKYIPIIITGLLVWSVVQWKMLFVMNLPTITVYNQCSSDWITHLVIFVVAAYTCVIAIYKYKKYHKYISTFWLLILLVNFTKFIISFFGCTTSEMYTCLNAMEILSLGVLVLHFIDIYIPRASLPKERRASKIITTKIEYIRCPDCAKENVNEK